MTVFGWDASDYDWQRGSMDLAAARRDGIDFFTHKATEATWTRHTHYGEAMARARDAGIPLLGAYHVVRSPANAAAEVDYMLSYVDSQTPWWRDFPCWFWQVDLEKWSYDAVPASEGEAFADIIEQRTGRRAVIYASRGQYGDQLTGTSHELWNANYGTNPTVHYRQAYVSRGGDSGPGWVTYSGRMPAIWQYGSRTTIGSQTICDANAFRGTLAELTALLSGDDMTPEEHQLLANVEHIVTCWDSMRDAVGVRYLGSTKDEPVHPNPLREIKAKVDQLSAPALTDEQLATIAEQAAALVGGKLEALLAATELRLEAKFRDAVADLGEGGAAAVRADES